jgi:hypothetical protein
MAVQFLCSLCPKESDFPYPRRPGEPVESGFLMEVPMRWLDRVFYGALTLLAVGMLALMALVLG